MEKLNKIFKMTNKTETLEEGDRFLFKKITIDARKFVFKGKFQGSGSHRATRYVATQGSVYVNRSWEAI